MTLASTKNAVYTVGPQDLLATPEGFRRWLNQQAPTAIVGFPNTVGACPLAQYLKDCGVQRPIVAGKWGVPGGKSYEMPMWAARFVRRVDVQWHAIHADFALAMLGATGRSDA